MAGAKHIQHTAENPFGPRLADMYPQRDQQHSRQLQQADYEIRNEEAVSYTHLQAQGATQAVLTVVDALGYLDEIPVCVGYEVDGKILRNFPTTPTLEKCKPVLEVLSGWKCDVRGITRYEDLPENCRKYVEFIEKELEVPITMVSNGPGREEIIVRK